jgi:hypothetical protein
VSLGWDAVRARYEPGTGVRPLVGGSQLTVVLVDDEQICLKQRLWQACVTRHELETAIDLLEKTPGPISAVEFAEELRRYYSGGPNVKTECSRVPNLSAVILKDLGYLD